MIWVILAMLIYTATIIVGAAASRHANTNLVTAVTNLVSALIPIAVVIPLIGKKTYVEQKNGIWLAVAAGLLIGIFVMALTKAYSVNKVGIVAPVVFGGAIFLSTLLSYFIFKEKVGLLQGVGLVLLAVGFLVIIYARATGK